MHQQRHIWTSSIQEASTFCGHFVTLPDIPALRCVIIKIANTIVHRSKRYWPKNWTIPKTIKPPLLDPIYIISCAVGWHFGTAKILICFYQQVISVSDQCNDDELRLSKFLYQATCRVSVTSANHGQISLPKTGAGSLIIDCYCNIIWSFSTARWPCQFTGKSLKSRLIVLNFNLKFLRFGNNPLTLFSSNVCFAYKTWNQNLVPMFMPSSHRSSKQVANK